MKDIKDYLHLYLPFEFMWHTDAVPFHKGERGIMEAHDLRYWDEHKKIILRPLSDMTEEEAIDIAIIMYGQPDSVKWRMEDKGNYFNVYRKHYSESFTIDKASGDIDRYSKEGDQMELQTTLQHHFITRYLLSKGFDLFNLHEQGLCLYKSDLLCEKK